MWQIVALRVLIATPEKQEIASEWSMITIEADISAGDRFHDSCRQATAAGNRPILSVIPQ